MGVVAWCRRGSTVDQLGEDELRIVVVLLLVFGVVFVLGVSLGRTRCLVAASSSVLPSSSTFLMRRGVMGSLWRQEFESLCVSLCLSFFWTRNEGASGGVTSKATQHSCEKNCHNIHYHDQAEQNCEGKTPAAGKLSSKTHQLT